MNLVELVKQAGVIGAGGGKFSTHVKPGARVAGITLLKAQLAMRPVRRAFGSAGGLANVVLLARHHPDVYREAAAI